jgi:hypothetical protein
MKNIIKNNMFMYTCAECGWSTARVFRMTYPRCSRCDSPHPPKVEEKEFLLETEFYETHTPEEYRKCRDVAMDIINGKPLEEIEGLDLDEELARTGEERALRGQWGRCFTTSFCPWIMFGNEHEMTTRDIVKKYNVSLIPFYRGETEYF